LLQTSAYSARPVLVLLSLSCGSCTVYDCRLETLRPDSVI